MDNVLKEAILNGLYDKDKNNGNEFLSPQLVSNDKENKIWFTLRQELLSATSFTWAVAFISENMLVPFKLVMSELAKKGISGTLITGTYLGFNSPKVFKELMKIPNLKVRLSEEAGFHDSIGLYQAASDIETDAAEKWLSLGGFKGRGGEPFGSNPPKSSYSQENIRSDIKKACGI